jgi:hypothetical protein
MWHLEGVFAEELLSQAGIHLFTVCVVICIISMKATARCVLEAGINVELFPLDWLKQSYCSKTYGPRTSRWCEQQACEQSLRQMHRL